MTIPVELEKEIDDPSVFSLNLRQYWSTLTAEDLTEIFTKLKDNIHITHINAEGCKFDDHAFLALLCYIAVNKAIVELNLNKTPINLASLNALIACLYLNSSLEKVSVSCNSNAVSVNTLKILQKKIAVLLQLNCLHKPNFSSLCPPKISGENASTAGMQIELADTKSSIDSMTILSTTPVINWQRRIQQSLEAELKLTVASISVLNNCCHKYWCCFFDVEKNKFVMELLQHQEEVLTPLVTSLKISENSKALGLHAYAKHFATAIQKNIDFECDSAEECDRSNSVSVILKTSLLSHPDLTDLLHQLGSMLLLHRNTAMTTAMTPSQFVLTEDSHVMLTPAKRASISVGNV